MSDYNNDDIKDTEDEQKYEDVCYMCRRPESKTGRMPVSYTHLTLPTN